MASKPNPARSNDRVTANLPSRDFDATVAFYGALGFEVVRSLQRSLFGLGFEVGLALVLIAMILDRFTEAWADRLRPPSSSGG